MMVGHKKTFQRCAYMIGIRSRLSLAEELRLGLGTLGHPWRSITTRAVRQVEAKDGANIRQIRSTRWTSCLVASVVTGPRAHLSGAV
jgi:hypothetical protein